MADDTDYQAVLDAAGAEPPAPPTHQQMLRAIGVAIADGLGSHSQQPELRSRWEFEQDRGRRLQVSGHIDLTLLEREVAQRVLVILAAFAGITLDPIPGESFDDL